jgi:biotin carboxyl carrier protein
MRNFVITVNGTTYQVGVEEVGATTAAPVAVPAPQAVAPVAAPAPQATPAPATQAAAPKAAAKPVANGEKVLSPFPGLIKNLLVAEGASVKKDQPILVLEAMKMDNDITAPCDGVVSFQVAKGANVESDAVLAVIG